MLYFTETAPSDQTLVPVGSSAAFSMPGHISEEIQEAADRGDREEVERLLREILAEGSCIQIGRPNDHAIMRAIAANV